MRIGIVSKFGAADGLCVIASYVLKGLVERGHDVHVMTQSRNVEGLAPERVHRFPAVYLNPHFSLDSPGASRMIAEVCADNDIEVLNIQMNSGSTEFLLPIFKRSLPPLVVTFHLAYAAGTSLTANAFTFAWKASLFVTKRYDGIVLVDPSQKPYLLRYGIPEERISVIRNGIDTYLFRPADYKNKREILNFIYVGRMSIDKGVNTLLDAFRIYHSGNPNSTLTLIGDGILKNQLTKYAGDGSIRWFGAINHELVPSILKRADVFVIPQIIGGLGLSVLEAMSCALPVITTAIGETTRLLRPNEGLLVEPNNAAAVADSMRLLGDDEQLRRSMGDNCRKKILREYSWSAQVGLLEQAFERTIKKRNDH